MEGARTLNKRIHAWSRFTEIFGDFCETFFDHVSRVKNRSAMASFEKKNSILTWEWKTIEALITTGDTIPAPHCAEALDVYLTIFSTHAEYGDLVAMKSGKTPLTAQHQWGPTAFCMSPRSTQARTREYDHFFNENKKSIRTWTRRWNAKSTAWGSRNRSAVCKFLRQEMCRDGNGHAEVRPDILDEWLREMPLLQPSDTLVIIQSLEYEILRRCSTSDDAEQI
jgi:hypothetical protein